jgi:hypothetical protein
VWLALAAAQSTLGRITPRVVLHPERPICLPQSAGCTGCSGSSRRRRLFRASQWRGASRARFTYDARGIASRSSVLHLFRAKIHDSARRPGIADNDLAHAYEHAIVWVFVG